MNVVWFLDDPIRYRKTIGLPEFSLESIRPSYCNGTYKYAITEESYKRGLFLKASIFLGKFKFIETPSKIIS